MADNIQTSVDFSALILGLSSAALSYMGYGTVDGSEMAKNLTLAQQNIDIIAMLREKTKGNLTADEDKLISEILADLQVKFAETR